MNREIKRTVDRSGGTDGTNGANGATADLGGLVAAPGRVREDPTPRRRTTPVQFVREIRDELRQVAWPTRSELVNYTAVVFVTLVLMVSLVFLLNYAFGKGVLFMFQK